MLEKFFDKILEKIFEAGATHQTIQIIQSDYKFAKSLKKALFNLNKTDNKYMKQKIIVLIY